MMLKDLTCSRGSRFRWLQILTSAGCLAFICLASLVASPIYVATAYADDALQVSYRHSEDGRVTATANAGLRARVIHDRVSFPLGMRKTHTGYWFTGGHFQQTLITFHGANVGERRLYRLSLPVDYIHDPAGVGPLRFVGRLEPAHYTDERLLDHRATQLEWAGRFSYDLRSDLAVVLGLKLDRRLGLARQYPVFGIEWQQSTRLNHHWVFPDWRSEYLYRKRTRLYAHIRPEGGQWRYGKYDAHENMHYVNWAFGVGIRHKTQSPFALKLEVGQNLYRKLIYSSGTTPLNDSTYWLVSLESRFGN